MLLDGQLEARWQDEAGVAQSTILNKGDLVRVENTSHTFVNLSTNNAVFVVFKLVPTGIDRREVIKNDKRIDQ